MTKTIATSTRIETIVTRANDAVSIADLAQHCEIGRGKTMVAAHDAITAEYKHGEIKNISELDYHAEGFSVDFSDGSTLEVVSA